MTTAMSEGEKSRDPSGEVSEIWAESGVVSGAVHRWRACYGGGLLSV